MQYLHRINTLLFYIINNKSQFTIREYQLILGVYKLKIIT